MPSSLSIEKSQLQLRNCMGVEENRQKGLRGQALWYGDMTAVVVSITAELVPSNPFPRATGG